MTIIISFIFYLHFNQSLISNNDNKKESLAQVFYREHLFREHLGVTTSENRFDRLGGFNILQNNNPYNCVLGTDISFLKTRLEKVEGS